jgi:DNA-binding transcriptional MerR regulator
MKKNRSKKWLFLPLAAIITFGITQLAYRFPSITEKVYSQLLYPFIARIISPISNIFSFSIDDFFYFLLILTFLLLIILLIARKISFVKTGKIVLNILAGTYILFYVLWGFNYFREDLYARLELDKHEPNTKAFLVQLKKIVENTNKSWCSFEKWDVETVDQSIEKSYKTLAPVLKIKYPSGKRNPKSITVSQFFAQAGISGYYGPFFNEVHVNSKILPVEYSFILAHEKAHQFGITNEAEANFYAWLVCTKSNSKQLQYSANLHVLQYFLYQGYQLEEYPEIIAKLDKRVKKDLQIIREHWMSMRNEKIDEAASKVNDFYLKTNKIKEGVKEYSGVVQFVMDYSNDLGFQERTQLNQ